MPTTPNLLKKIAANVQSKLLADLAQSQPIEHSGTKGDSTETAWISLFKNYLPTRFRIAKGIIIDCNGQTSGQIDCIIFDSQYTPQIIPNEVSLYIPAEAVHAVFEVKQNINKEHLEYAANKVKSVRDLKRTSVPYTGDGRVRESKPVFNIIGGLLATSCDYADNLGGETFIDNLKSANSIAPLDFVFSATDGYADLARFNCHADTNNDSSFIVQGEASINYGLIRLLEELSLQGTVQAVEWPKYLENLATPETIAL